MSFFAILYQSCTLDLRQISFPLNVYQRTSDSLNERLPIKMAREKFQRKRYFYHEMDSRFYSQIIRKSVFLIGQVPIEKYGFKTLFLLFNT